MYESKKSIKSQPVRYMIQFTTFIPIFELVNVSGRHRDHFGQERNKRKKEMMLNCCNLKCFKTEYQLVKSIIKTLF